MSRAITWSFICLDVGHEYQVNSHLIKTHQIFNSQFLIDWAAIEWLLWIYFWSIETWLKGWQKHFFNRRAVESWTCNLELWLTHYRHNQDYVVMEYANLEPNRCFCFCVHLCCVLVCACLTFCTLLVVVLKVQILW